MNTADPLLPWMKELNNSVPTVDLTQQIMGKLELAPSPIALTTTTYKPIIGIKAGALIISLFCLLLFILPLFWNNQPYHSSPALDKIIQSLDLSLWFKSLYGYLANSFELIRGIILPLFAMTALWFLSQLMDKRKLQNLS